MAAAPSSSLQSGPVEQHCKALLPPMPTRRCLRLPLLADAAMAVAGNGSVAAADAASDAGGANSAAAAAPTTLTTPTLTPTTLRNIEQMFMDSEKQSGADELRPPDPHENSARFAPPSVSMDNDSVRSYHQQQQDPPYTEVKSEEVWVADSSVLPGPPTNEKASLPLPLPLPPPPPPPQPPTPPPISHFPVTPAPSVELPTIPLRLLPTEPVPCSAVKTSVVNGDNVPSPPIMLSSPPHPPPLPLVIRPPPATISLPTQPVNSSILSKEVGPPWSAMKKKKGGTSLSGGRKPGAVSHRTPEEEQKKLLRRQRNKEAAARCRKRRLDQTLALQDEVEDWEARNTEMEDEIRALERQKVDLDALLSSHQRQCKVTRPERKQPRRRRTRGGKRDAGGSGGSNIGGGAAISTSSTSLAKDIHGVKKEVSSNQ